MGDPAPKVQAAVAVIEIAFREVDQLYHLFDGRRVIESQGRPRAVYESRRFAGYSATLDSTYEDDLGNPVKAVKAGADMLGVYQGVRIHGHNTILRTFSRKLTEKVHDKWVYLFSSEAKNGDKMSLAGELSFDGGEFRLVDLAAHAKKDERPAAGEKRSKLYIEVKDLKGDKGPYLWFLLTPYQIPWAGLEKMRQSGKLLASRCQRLFDEFWMDGYLRVATRSRCGSSPTRSRPASRSPS